MKEILKELNNRKLFYIVTLVSFILYFFIKIDILPVVGASFFIMGVLSESYVNATEKGIKSEFKEIIIALIVALGLWYGAIFILGTDMPFNAVVSCSMLDTLHRGDVIILKGAIPTVSEINISREEYDTIIKNNEEHFICGICINEFGGKTPCSINPYTMEMEYGEVLKYNCGYCEEVTNNIKEKVVCTHGVTIKNEYFSVIEKKGDIVVYRPKETDVFSLVGDIIHRSVVRINVDGTEDSYYLIKGDNNAQFDAQMFNQKNMRTNSMVHESQIKGKSIFSIPFLGYVKLVASGQIANPPGCETRLFYE